MRLIATGEERIDRYLAKSLQEPRSQVEQLIKKGCVKVDGVVVKKGGFKVKEGQEIWIDFPKFKRVSQKMLILILNVYMKMKRYWCLTNQQV